jgi:hypothetical protein
MMRSGRDRIARARWNRVPWDWSKVKSKCG